MGENKEYDAIIIGGGSVGCEAGLYLAQKGWSVTILEQLSKFAGDLHEANQEMLLELLEKHAVRLEKDTKVKEIKDANVYALSKGQSAEYSADLIVLAVGSKSENYLLTEIESLVEKCFTIGDCRAPRKIKDAVWEAFKMARLV